MKKLIIVLGICLTATIGFGQQLFHQTQFMVNPYTLNPALAGSQNYTDIKAGYRNQWVGFDDSDGYIDGPIAPRTMYLSAHTSLGRDNEYYKDPRNEKKAYHGIGGFITSDKLGAFSSNSIYGSYSFNMPLISPKKSTGQMYNFNGQEKSIGVRMIVGAHLGVVQQRVDTELLVPGSQLLGLGGDPKIDNIGNANGWGPDGSLGIWIYSTKFYVGLAVRRLLANDVEISAIDYSLSRHYNLMAGYKLRMSHFLVFEPSMNVKFESGANPSVDLNGKLAYDNTYANKQGSGNNKNKDLNVYIGATYRYGAAAAILIGGVIEQKYEIAYSFDITTNKLGPYQKGTHEVTIGYRILPGKHFKTAEHHHRR